MRATLRVRRASTPLRIHTSSCASSLSARALASASDGQLLFLQPLVGAEVARVAAQHAAVELDDARGHRVEEGAVVGDQHHAALEAAQQLLEPGDRVQVQVVGGLVEQQHLGHGHQRLRQRDALLHAAGQAADVARAVQVQLRQRGVDALLPGPGVQRLDARLQRVEVVARRMRLVARAQRLGLGHAFADDVEDAVRRLEQRLLRHVADAQALRHLQQSVVELLQAGQHLQQRGLAGAVAADQAKPLAGLERERRAVEQCDMAVGQVGVREGQDGHGWGVDARAGAIGSVRGAAIMGSRCVGAGTAAAHMACDRRMRPAPQLSGAPFQAPPRSCQPLPVGATGNVSRAQHLLHRTPHQPVKSCRHSRWARVGDPGVPLDAPHDADTATSSSRKQAREEHHRDAAPLPPHAHACGIGTHGPSARLSAHPVNVPATPPPPAGLRVALLVHCCASRRPANAAPGWPYARKPAHV